MQKLKLFCWIQVLVFLFSCTKPESSTNSEEKAGSETLDSIGDGNYTAHEASEEIVIDGKGDEKSWEKATWAPLKYKWLGGDYTPEDFSGRYKILWNEDKIYYLVEITDEILNDQRPDPFNDWWEDDCLELFIDEDKSGGNHQFNHNAFAYHITLDYDAVDIGPDQKPHLYNKDVETKRTKNGNIYTWEVGMKVFKDTYKDGEDNEPVKLTEGKKLGFAVSYNDNDTTGGRENFVGSMEIPGEDKNRGWIDAGLFGTLELVK